MSFLALCFISIIAGIIKSKTQNVEYVANSVIEPNTITNGTNGMPRRVAGRVSPLLSVATNNSLCGVPGRKTGCAAN